MTRGRGIFWVSGKPGSGKSTLLKFITDEPRTHELLSEWANPRSAILISHFFWNAGTSMQKSLHGLLQSLLYDMFRQCPQHISTACSDRWSKSDDNPPWTTQQLKASLESILSKDLPGVKFCFFIDGMDEYEGDHLELCGIFKTLAESSHIKLCLSSRPWNVFNEAFGRSTTRLRVHELTKQDIRMYTTSRLQEHPRWNTATTPEQGELLIEDISTRAWGVFLWAVLVIRLVREGLTNRDRFSDMCRRINRVPEELQDFFRQILDTVEPFYRSKMSTTLQIAVAAKDPLHFLLYDFHDQEYDDVDYALSLPVQSLSLNEMNETREVTICRLESRTRGLLELQNGSDTVAFLHRTVKDFLNSHEMTQHLAAIVATDLRFRANLSITKALLAWMKSSAEIGYGSSEPVVRKKFGSYTRARRNEAVPSNHPVHLFEKLLAYAAELDIQAFPEADPELAEILDATNEFLVKLLRAKNVIVGRWKPESLFREQLVTSCVYNYFQAEVTRDQSYIESLGSGLAMHLVFPQLEFAKAHAHLYRQAWGLFLRLVFKLPADPVIEKAYLNCFEHFIGPRTTLTRLGISESFLEPWRGMKPDAAHRRSPFIASIAFRLLSRAGELKASGVAEEIEEAIEQLVDNVLIESLKKEFPVARGLGNNRKRSASVSTTDSMSSSTAATHEYVESINGDGTTRSKVARIG
ncbi:hypothetical protein SLS63_009544 [Diaporthe eres]|uniref:NACHT domain-containing protein n=1 Tax=Diaporthe eres TaxID=83184 RepID=A0ABR1NZ94_DIAER